MTILVPVLLSPILRGNATDVLSELYKAKTETEPFSLQQLILGIATELNSQRWIDQVQEVEKRLSQRKFSRKASTLKIEDIHHCSYLVMNFIITLIDPKEAVLAEAIWTQIFKHPLAKKISVDEELSVDRHFSFFVSSSIGFYSRRTWSSPSPSSLNIAIHRCGKVNL